jgi:predicted dithiol-disulfide oxidoreductase (DUF899 family)
LERFKQRMGWTFKWVSAGENGFNYDYNVSFTPDVIAKGEAMYNYQLAARAVAAEYARASEHAGMSAFYKNSEGKIFHTYSAYARGLDTLNCAYRWLDLMPKGRNEDGLPHTMSWIRHHDRCGDTSHMK